MNLVEPSLLANPRMVQEGTAGCSSVPDVCGLENPELRVETFSRFSFLSTKERSHVIITPMAVLRRKGSRGRAPKFSWLQF